MRIPLTATLVSFALVTTAFAGPRHRISPEGAEQLRALHQRAAQLRSSGGMDEASRAELIAKARAVVEAEAEDARAAARERFEQIKAKVSARIPQEVKDRAAALREAAGKVKADLQAIRGGAYVSRDDLKELGRKVAAAASDRDVTDAEKEEITSAAQALAGQIPSGMREQLKADVAAFVEELPRR